LAGAVDGIELAVAVEFVGDAKDCFEFVLWPVRCIMLADID